MPITINGSGTVTGISATGISAQPVFPGNILQVVSATYGTYTSINSTSYTDTGLSASITPSSASSKILVLIQQPAGVVGAAAIGYGNQVNGGIQLVRGSTVLLTPPTDGGGKYTLMLAATGTLAHYAIVNFKYLDSPSTTSAVTYKTQAAKGTSGMGSIDMNQGTSSIILMEVAA